MIKILDQKFSKDKWNSVANHPLQSWEWGEVRKKTGVQILRLGAFRGNELKEVFQMTLHKIPKTSYSLGYIPRSIMPSKSIRDFLQSWGQKNNLIFIKFEPYIEKKEINNAQIEQINTLHRSPHQLFPDWTIIMDISPSEDDLLKKMKSKTRYNIRLAEKKGVTVEETSTDEGFKKFSALYFATTKRQHYFGHDARYHKIVWDELKKSQAYIMIANFQDIPLAAYELFIFKDRAYYPYGGSSSDYKNVMAPNLLMWEAIKFSKQKGAKIFDMWGAAAPESTNTNTFAGFTRFKEGYGGSYIQFVGSFDLVIRPGLYTIYNALYKLRSFYLNLSFSQ